MVGKFVIKNAAIEDMKEVFDLSNDELVRQSSFSKEKIEWKNHQIWFKNKLKDTNCIFYIINVNKGFLGYVRLDKENNDWIITIHLKSDFRGKGFGTKILKEICNLNKDKKIIAFVKEKNQASYKSFLNVGFKKMQLINKCNESFYKLEKINEYNCD